MSTSVLGQLALTIPAGTSANRPATPVAGMTRVNTDSAVLEYYNGSSWQQVTIFSPSSISGLVGWYDVGSVNGTTWTDKSGSGNNATISGATVQSTSGNGSNISSALYGSASSHSVLWPAAIVPTTYTLFHVTRYTGGTNSRIYTSADSTNWLSGHWGGASGVAYHSGWLTGSGPSIHGNNWVISTDQNSLYRSNGVTRGTSGAGSPSNARLTINASGYGSSEWSTWMTTECIVYNRTLSSTEYGQVETWLSNKYSITLG